MLQMFCASVDKGCNITQKLLCFYINVLFQSVEQGGMPKPGGRDAQVYMLDYTVIKNSKKEQKQMESQPCLIWSSHLFSEGTDV